MKHEAISRRAFLRSAGQAVKGSAFALSLPAILVSCERAQEARLSGADFSILSEAEALEFEAMAARIIPSDDTPGASEAGVVYFMDTVLSDNRERELELMRSGLLELQAQTAIQFDQPYFYLIDSVQQDHLLGEIENTEFFNTVRMLTIAGMFSLPEYGGNRDNVGYELIGFSDQHAWQPPFGFYDADYAEKGE